MNAFSAVREIAVRKADLAREARAIEAFVAAHPGAEPFHRPAWSVGVERGTGQRSHYLVASRGEATAGVLPLSEVRSPFFGNALVSAGFGVGGGILTGDEAAREALAGAAWKLATELGCPSVELRGGDVPAGWTRFEGTYSSFARDLPGTDEAILNAIPRKQRAEVRRARGFGFEVRVGCDSRDLDDHYRVYSESVRNLGTPVFPRALFCEMLEVFGEDADILTLHKNGRTVASVFNLYFNNSVYPYWGGGIAEARGSRANELLYYELMRHAARRGCTRFDFGRSKNGTGAFAYKKNWGFAPRPLAYAVRTADGAAPRQINPLNAKYRLQVAAWRRLPLWLANRLGPPIARGLG